MALLGDEVEIKRSICHFCTTVCCAIKVHVKGTRILGSEADTECPMNPGPFCPRCGPYNLKFASEYFHSKNRTRFPMRRVGERGSGRWEQLSWKEALDEIAEKLKEVKEKYGAEAIATTKGTGRNAHEWARTRFMFLYGTPNHVGINHICFTPSAWPDTVTFGFWPMIYMVPSTRCITFFGGNCPESTPVSWRGYVSHKEKLGTKLIVADPRFTESARIADSWLQLRPGTDGAIFLAWLHVIINEELYDKEFVKKWCYGFDKLKERVQQYTPEWAEKVTGVPKEKIIESARMYAANKPACSYHGNAPEASGRNTFQALRAKGILKAITGNLDVDGGEVMVPNPPEFTSDRPLELYEKLPPKQRVKMLGTDRFKMMTTPGYDLICESVTKAWGPNSWPTFHETIEVHPGLLYRAILEGKPYPVKAVLVFASNPLVAFPDTKNCYKALKAVDLLVVSEFVWTPTAEIADYVLPSACSLETPDCSILPGLGISDLVVAGEAAVPRKLSGEYDRLADMEIWRELAVRLGQEEYWPWKNIEEFMGWRFKPLIEKFGLSSFDEFVKKKRWYSGKTEFKKYEKTGFGTPTGKVECYSTILEKLGYDPLPYYEEPAESPLSTPLVAKEYPLILTSGGRFLPMHHSEFREVKSARSMHPDPIIDIHPDTARNLGISDGDWVWVETRRGRIKHKARLTPGILPNVVHIQHGWWFPEMPREEPWLRGVWESNANVLTDSNPDRCDQHIGTWGNRTMLCKVYPVKSWQEEFT